MADQNQGVDGAAASLESVTEAVKSLEVRQSRKRTASNMSQSFIDVIDDELNGPLPPKVDNIFTQREPEPIEADDDEWTAGTTNTFDIRKLPLFKPSQAEVARAAASEEPPYSDCSPVSTQNDKTPPEVERPYGFRRAVRRLPITVENWENSSTPLDAAESDAMWADTEDE